MRKENIGVRFYAGALIPRKGVHHLVAAFARVAASSADCRLIIVGREENKEYVIGLMNQVEDLGLKDRVQFAER
jgi:glycosyltransferase involved in cell wall biosynthesis